MMHPSTVLTPAQRDAVKGTIDAAPVPRSQDPAGDTALFLAHVAFDETPGLPPVSIYEVSAADYEELVEHALRHVQGAAS